jgi:stage IV sporulation protein FB
MWSGLINAFGIRFRFHPLFVLLMLCSMLTGRFLELATLFGIVLIHELGHVAAAKHFGWRVTEVQLLPFGGVAEVDESGNVPARQEFWVALAGPLQNAWMIGFAWAMKTWGGGDPAWWDYFMEANVWIGGFNLLPVLPLDGGKMLLALLSYPVSYYRASNAAVWTSLAVSALAILASVFPLQEPGLRLNGLILGLFLFYSNWFLRKNLPYHFLRFLMSRERRAAEHVARGVHARPILVVGSRRVPDILRMFMREQYHLIYVCSQQGAIRRVIPEQRLVRAYLRDPKPGSAISDLIV